MSRWPLSRAGSHVRRPISTYDMPVGAAQKDDEVFADTKLNGIRVWYSSFTSVDWLHDAIKDSSRLFRLRSRKSFRGRLRSNLDRTIDWITVTIVGFLTAVVAWLIIRSEQWLFDLKEGRCVQGWWRARRFCPAWEDWAEVFGAKAEGDESRTWLGSSAWATEYIAYSIVAVRPFGEMNRVSSDLSYSYFSLSSLRY